jgi:hypothetical protein
MINDTHRRYPRDLNEAFGPNCRKDITEPTRPIDRQDRAVLWGCMAAVIAIIAIGCLT